MYIIDETYFNRELSIPNVNEAQSEVFDTVNSFVDEYARQLLRDALGIEIFNVLDSYVIDGVFDETSAPQYIIDLVNGKEYVKDDITYKWSGLISEEGVFKKSLLANYVYCKWFESSITYQSGVGEVTINATNANLVNPTQRLVNYWNKFIEMYQDICNYKPAIYYKSNVRIIDWQGQTPNTQVSLIQYLLDNEQDFTNCPMILYEVKNQLGI